MSFLKYVKNNRYDTYNLKLYFEKMNFIKWEKCFIYLIYI